MGTDSAFCLKTKTCQTKSSFVLKAQNFPAFPWFITYKAKLKNFKDSNLWIVNLIKIFFRTFSWCFRHWFDSSVVKILKLGLDASLAANAWVVRDKMLGHSAVTRFAISCQSLHDKRNLKVLGRICLKSLNLSNFTTVASTPAETSEAHCGARNCRQRQCRAGRQNNPFAVWRPALVYASGFGLQPTLGLNWLAPLYPGAYTPKRRHPNPRPRCAKRLWPG